jgi:hypothetical protein
MYGYVIAIEGRKCLDYFNKQTTDFATKSFLNLRSFNTCVVVFGISVLVTVELVVLVDALMLLDVVSNGENVEEGSFCVDVEVLLEVFCDGEDVEESSFCIVAEVSAKYEYII